MQYWQHAPAVFNWDPDVDHSPCPLAWTYQLVRNVLAATVRQDRVETASGHALIIYDERNPAFRPGGDARSAYDAVCKALRHPGLLRTVSWQRVIDQLSAAGDLHWLVDGLEAKYGLTNSATVLPETVGRVPGRQLPGPGRQIAGPLVTTDVTTGFLILSNQASYLERPVGTSRWPAHRTSCTIVSGCHRNFHN